MNTWDTVEGWFDPADVLVYQNLARTVRAAPVVEVGSWKGKSAASIAHICRDNGCVLFCVDTWAGSEEHQYLGDGLKNLMEEFKQNMNRLGYLGSPIVPIVRASIEAAAAIANLGIKPRLVFLDAAHDFESVSADIIAWSSVMHPDGIIAGHDYNPGWIGVVGAVQKLCPRAVCNQHGSAIWYANVRDVISK